MCGFVQILKHIPGTEERAQCERTLLSCLHLGFLNAPPVVLVYAWPIIAGRECCTYRLLRLSFAVHSADKTTGTAAGAASDTATGTGTGTTGTGRTI